MAQPAATSPHGPIIALVGDDELRAPIRELADELDTDVIWSLDVAGVVSRVVELRPAVLLVDLRHDADRWPDIVRALKSNPATRRLAVIGFAKGLDDELRAAAEAVIFDEVFEAADDPRGGLLTSLPTRVKAYARQADDDLRAALEAPCQQPMPQLVYQALQEFNNGHYYEAHEDLEHAWMDEEHEVRNLYQGILQAGVAYYQIRRGNYWGAVKMFLRAFQWLSAMPDECHGIDVAKLRRDARQVWRELESLGPDNIEAFDSSLFQPVRYDPAYEPPQTNPSEQEHDSA